MPIFVQSNKNKLMCGGSKIAKMYCQWAVIYSSGNVVTYHVDSGTTYQEEVDEGASCLSPKTFTPTKSGWEFVGWRADSTANGTVLTSKVMGDDLVTLYAVFRQSVTVTYYNNSTTASSESKYRYYNNGNTADPSFTLTQTASTGGWTCRGWSTSNKGDASIAYANGATFIRDSNVTLYGLYQQTITVTYYDNSSTAKTISGTRYWAPAGYINPSFTLAQAARSGWTARGWSTSNAGNGSISYNNATAFTRDSNVTLYGCYQQTITVTYYNNSTTASTTTGTRYYNSSGNIVNPSFTLTQTASSGWTARGWSPQTAGNGRIDYGNGLTAEIDSSVTLYGMYQQTITVTYYNGTLVPASTSGTRYYNSGSGAVVNPTFSLTPVALSGWTFRGWATSSAAAASIAYNSISGTAFAANASVYACYYQTITLSYSGNGATSGSTAAQTGTRYFNSGSYSNPSFTLSSNGFSRSGASFLYWAMGSVNGTTYNPANTVTLTASTIFYAKWKISDAVLDWSNLSNYDYSAGLFRFDTYPGEVTRTLYNINTSLYSGYTISIPGTNLRGINATTGYVYYHLKFNGNTIRSGYTRNSSESGDIGVEDTGTIGYQGKAFTLTVNNVSNISISSANCTGWVLGQPYYGGSITLIGKIV